MTLSPSALKASALLIVEDDRALLDALRPALGDVADLVLAAGSVHEAVAALAAHEAEVVILDLGLPDIAGADACREVRARTAAPILVLTARDSGEEKVRLLDAGADDYVTKPFATDELLARVRALVRRSRGTPAGARVLSTITDGDLVLDLEEGTAERAGQPIKLTRIELAILRTLASQPGRTFTHRQIFDAVWARPYGNPSQYLRVYMTHLRQKLEQVPATPRLLITDPGVGYRLELPVRRGDE
ncbi:MAG: response regulator transcription factor [Gemmatimonadetes bacterium]|nr:response regulator transcription factor [Gemmatimonadota bacterium]